MILKLISVVSFITLNVGVNSLDFQSSLLRGLKGKINAQCQKDMATENKSINKFNMEAISAWNSTAPGFVGGSHDYTGDYKSCLELPHVVNMTLPQYCIADVLVTYKRACNPSLKDRACSLINTSDGITVAAKWALCAPSSCTKSDLQHLADLMLKKSPIGSAGLPFNVSLWDHGCQTPGSKPFRTDTIAFFCMIGAIAILVITCTVWHWWKKDSKAEVSPLILHWSLIENFPLLAMHGSDEIMAFHRVRVITMWGLIYIHHTIFMFTAPFHNLKNVLWVLNIGKYFRVDLLVDVFFAMAGFLLAANFPELNSMKSRTKLVIKRYFRLVPSFAVVIFFVTSAMEHMTSGPYWPAIVGVEQDSCRKHWLQTILLLGNYGDWSDYCWLTSWYLPVDFHCFILGVCICSVIKWNKTLGLAALASVSVGSILILGGQIYYNNWMVHLPVFRDFTRNIRGIIEIEQTYIKTHMRMSSYFIGMLFGYISSVKKANNEVISKNVTKLAYGLAFVFMMIAMTISSILEFEPDGNPLYPVLYGALLRPVWVLGFSIFISVWMLRQTDSKASTMDRYFWLPLSRLCFSIYLVHTTFQFSAGGSKQHPYHFYIPEAILMVLWDSMKAIIPSLLLYLCVEIPCARLIKMILTENRKSSHVKEE